MNYKQQLETKLVPGQEVFGATYIRDLEPKTYKCGTKCRVVECRCTCGKVFPILFTTLMKQRPHICRDCQDGNTPTRNKPAIGANITLIPNQKYSHLTYIGEQGIRQATSPRLKYRIVRCRCDCGNIVDISATSLIKPTFHACRDCQDARLRIPQTDVRVQNPRLWSIYQGMIYRCLMSKVGSSSYKNYRGRGITVCHEWLNNFEAFVKWALSHGYDSKLSIDRINVNGNYEPSNCRWADAKIQANNQRPRRSQIRTTIQGETLDLKTISEKYHIPYERLYMRYKKGYRGDVLVAPRIVLTPRELLKKHNDFLL